MKTEFEKYADALANTDDLEEAIRNLEKGFIEINKGEPIDWSQKGYILIGNDTRESSPLLVGLLKYLPKFSPAHLLGNLLLFAEANTSISLMSPLLNSTI